MPFDLNNATFGVEFEITVPVHVLPRVGGRHAGVQVADLPAGWNAQSDSSIRPVAGHKGVEIVSPVLKGQEGLQQIKAVCEWMQAVGAKVNTSTGFHVHVGWTGEAQELDRLVHLVANHEKAIYAATGTKSREQGHYCQSVQADASYQRRFRDGLATGTPGRMHLLNLTNLTAGSSKRTVEFRAFAGTLRAVKAIGYVRLCLGLVERAFATTRNTPWVAKQPVESSPLARSGEGETALCRLMYALGWTKGRAKKVYGNLQATGVPSLKAHKNEFVRLAKKYDGNDQSGET